jgi:hypothetical protein
VRLSSPKTPGPYGMEPTLRLDFLSSDELAGQGVTLYPTATPPTVNRGMTLDGSTQYAKILLSEYSAVFSGGVIDEVSIYEEFWPDFNYNEAVRRPLWDGSGGANVYACLKSEVGPDYPLLFFAGAFSLVATINASIYGPFWRVGAKNKILFSGKSGPNAFYLNGYSIGTSANLWSVLPSDNVCIGATPGNFFFDGVISDFRMYSRKLTDAESIELTTVESTVYELHGDTVGVVESTDRFGWMYTGIGSPLLDIAEPEIAAGIAEGAGRVVPYIGPQFSLNGTISTGRPGPWRLSDHRQINGAHFSPGAYLGSTTDYTVGTSDVVFAALINTGTTTTYTGQGDAYWISGLTDATISNYISFYTQSPYGCHVNTHPVFGVQLDLPIIIGVDTVLLSATITRGGNLDTYCSGVPRASNLTPAPAFADLLRFSIGAAWNGGGSVKKRMIVYRVMWWVGAGIGATANALWHQRLATSVLGTWPKIGASGSYTRGTYPIDQNERCYYPEGRTGRCCIVGFDTPPAGGAIGVGVDESITSVATFNHSIPTGAGAVSFLADLVTPGSDVGLVTSIVDDDTNMAQCRDAGPLVLRIQNPTSGILYQRLGDVLGASGWVSIRARVVAGSVALGIQTAGGAFVAGVNSLLSGYVRNAALVSGGTATDRLTLRLGPSTDVYVILWCAGVGTRIQDEVPSLKPAGGGTTIPQGRLITGQTLADADETVELTVTPQTNGAAVPTSAVRVLTQGIFDVNILTIGVPSANTVSTSDFTNLASCACNEVDGIPETFRTTHSGTRLYIAKIGEASGETVYDGAMPTFGPLAHVGTCREISCLRVLRAAIFSLV